MRAISVAFSPASRAVRKRRTWLVLALSRAIRTRSKAAPRFGGRTATREPRRSEHGRAHEGDEHNCTR